MSQCVGLCVCLCVCMCLSVYVSVCMCVSLTRRNTFFLQVLEDTYHMRQPITPLTSDTPRLRQHVLRSPVARRHANALPTKAAQIPMAHHERTWPHGLSTHQKAQRHHGRNFATPSATSDSSSERLFPARHLYYKLATSESSSKTLFPALHLYYKLATSESISESLSRTTFVLQTGHFSLQL